MVTDHAESDSGCYTRVSSQLLPKTVSNKAISAAIYILTKKGHQIWNQHGRNTLGITYLIADNQAVGRGS